MSAPTSTVSLSVAGLAIELLCDHPGLAAALNRRYSAFPLQSEPVFRAVIGINSDPDSFLANDDTATPEMGLVQSDLGVSFVDGLVRFTAPGYNGYIDPSQGQGEFFCPPLTPVEDCDYFLRVAVAVLAFQAGGLLFHAAGIVREGKAYLFFGHSGSGKTTVSRLSDGATVLNDDLVVLQPENSGWQVHATPFWNPTQVRPTCRSAPLIALYRLVQSKQVFRERMLPGQALAEMVASVPVIPVDFQRIAPLLARLRGLLTSVPAYRLHFLPEASFWNVVASQGQ